MSQGLARYNDIDLYLPRTPILSAAQTARVMGFPSTEALAKARQDDRLPIPMFQLPGRRGWFASTQVVRAWLETSLRLEGTSGESQKEVS